MGKYGKDYARECRERKAPAAQDINAAIDEATEPNYPRPFVKKYTRPTVYPCDCDRSSRFCCYCY